MNGAKKICGGILVPETLHYLQSADLEIPGEIISEPNPVNLAYWDFDNDIDCVRNVNYTNIARQQFDRWLLELVPREVDILFKTMFLACQRQGNQIKLITQDAEKHQHVLFTRYLIGADGALSTVRKFIGNKVRTYLAVQEWTATNEAIDDIVFIYDHEITDFYSWLIPKDGLLIIGSAFKNYNKNAFIVLKNKLQQKGVSIGRTLCKESRMLSRPLSGHDILLGDDRILLTGEAAGFIECSGGEGISFALRSSACLAKSLLKHESILKDYYDYCEPLINELRLDLEYSIALHNPYRRKQILLLGR